LKKADLVVKVTKQVHLTEIPSASGIVYAKDKIFVVGDDSPWLYTLNKEFEIIRKQRLSSLDSMVNGRMPKSIKPDFESLGSFSSGGADYLLVLPSGSIMESRDTAYTLFLAFDDLIKHRNVRPVFEQIKQQAGMDPDDEINIEGLAISDDRAYLFHRGNISGNFIAVFEAGSLLYHIDNDLVAIPEAEIYPIDLPGYGQVQSGFSGASMLPDQSGLLFSASLENTMDVVSDGEILGSYIGLMASGEPGRKSYRYGMVQQEGKMLALKIEGLAIQNVTGNKIRAFAVCDNDNGTSEILELEIFF
jgi:hypothetical protein